LKDATMTLKPLALTLTETMASLGTNQEAQVLILARKAIEVSSLSLSLKPEPSEIS